jgi:methylthioribose-1-phosphate isomerase
MGTWIKPNTYTGIPRPESDVSIVINGYTINKPGYFKNKAHARAFEIALVLAQKKSSYTYSQRMGDIEIKVTAPVSMDTSECIDCIMFRGPGEIQLNIDAVNPRQVAYDAMKLVPSFFEPGVVILSQKKKCRKIWYLEILKSRS